MAQPTRGRRTHAHTGDLTVFLIGMRINRPWRPDAWLPVLAAMPRMLAELARDPDSGFLGARTVLGPGGPTVVQYWRRPEDVYRYARDRDRAHRPAWAVFHRRARRVPGAVGVWHETYEVARAETVYVDVPDVGLAAVGGSRPVTGRTDTAAQRLAA
jgi:hypothetical protein